MNYSLYDTFNVSGMKSLTKEQHASLQSSLQNPRDNATREAVFMLVCEHAKREGKFEYSAEGKQSLPYGLQEDDVKGEVVFDLMALPVKLRCILYKFCSILDKEDE